MARTESTWLMTGRSAEYAVAARSTFGGFLKRNLRWMRVSMELHFRAPDCDGTCKILVQSSNSSATGDQVSRFNILRTLLTPTECGASYAAIVLVLEAGGCSRGGTSGKQSAPVPTGPPFLFHRTAGCSVLVNLQYAGLGELLLLFFMSIFSLSY